MNTPCFFSFACTDGALYALFIQKFKEIDADGSGFIDAAVSLSAFPRVLSGFYVDNLSLVVIRRW